MLYGSFITLFIHILNLLGIGEPRITSETSFELRKAPDFRGLFCWAFLIGTSDSRSGSRPEVPIDQRILSSDDAGAIFQHAQNAL